MATTTHPSLGRNEPCHCGSGRKYKHCCLEKDQSAERAARAESQTSEAEQPAADAAAAPPPSRRAKSQTHQPWKRTATNTHGFQRMSAPRKIGSS